MSMKQNYRDGGSEVAAALPCDMPSLGVSSLDLSPLAGLALAAGLFGEG